MMIIATILMVGIIIMMAKLSLKTTKPHKHNALPNEFFKKVNPVSFRKANQISKTTFAVCLNS